MAYERKGINVTCHENHQRERGRWGEMGERKKTPSKIFSMGPGDCKTIILLSNFNKTLHLSWEIMKARIKDKKLIAWMKNRFLILLQSQFWFKSKARLCTFHVSLLGIFTHAMGSIIFSSYGKRAFDEKWGQLVDLRMSISLTNYHSF